MRVVVIAMRGSKRAPTDLAVTITTITKIQMMIQSGSGTAGNKARERFGIPKLPRSQFTSLARCKLVLLFAILT